MWKRVYRTFLGFLCGYVAYLPAIFIVEYALYGRVDSERAFYALYYAVGAPFLLSPSNWEYLQNDELILNLVGALLIASGIIIANSKYARALISRFAHRNSVDAGCE
jgi:hypothetical protein